MEEVSKNSEDGEEGEEGDEESLASTISYHSEDFISGPILSEKSTVPLNVLEFHYSFGYDCRKRFNLCVLDPDTLIFASGNLIHFFNVEKNQLTFRRCSTGGGIGHITKNSKFNHIAIGENGVNPPIIIYEWPSLDIVTVLHGGTTRSYSHLRFSPNGLDLVSQGGEPDYLITVWDWQRSKIRLQCKSHGQDVYNVVFSSTMPGHMTSCGAGHIKCWKMAHTFTGLKLQGELGRFGKTEISDIVGVYPMPDEKIISGCEWGNILVWDEGLIKIEVCRKNNKPCHTGYVSQFEYTNGELISVGTDGYVRVWYYETIDLAEPSEESNLIEVEPIHEFKIDDQNLDGEDASSTSMLMQIQKKNLDDPDCTLWYAQDGNGAIWLVNLSMTHTPESPMKLMRCHAGPVVDMDVADWGPYAASLGSDGRLYVHDYREKKLIFTHFFKDVGCCVIWLSSSVEPSGSTLVCGFQSGVIRMISINLQRGDEHDGETNLTKVLKPHTEKITRMTINPANSILVTGSEDLTIFAFQIRLHDSYLDLVPIGYVVVPTAVTCMTWKPHFPTTIFVGCARGECIEVNLPEEPQNYTTISYKLSRCKPIVFKFESVKSSIIREKLRLEDERLRMARIAVKREELKKMLESNPGIEIDEEVFFEAEMKEGELPELYIPEVPNSVLAAFYTSRNTVLLFMGGYDAGYTYEFSNPELGKSTVLVNAIPISDCDEEIRGYLFCSERKYIILIMEHGVIRVCKMNPDDDADFSNYWKLAWHDNFVDKIPNMCLSYDEEMLLTCGHDGNIFSFYIRTGVPVKKPQIPQRKSITLIPIADVIDIEELDHPSIEQVVVKAEQDRIMANAKKEKERILGVLSELSEQYDTILKRNESLPLSQRLTDEELELDPRITADLIERLDAEMDIVYKKLANTDEKSKIRLKKLMDHFIEPITCLPFAVKRILKPTTMIYSLRELKLTGDYAVERVSSDENLENLCQFRPERDDLDQTLDLERLDESPEDSDDGVKEGGPTRVRPLESFLRGLSPRTVQYHLGEEINSMLKKYRSLKAKLEEQEHEWKILHSEKPDPNEIDPEDENALEHAKNTVGDYKLKVLLGSNYDAENRPTVVSKQKEIVECRRKIHFRRENFNDKLRKLRTRKVELQNEVMKLITKLENIHAEIPAEWHKPLPSFITIDQDVEFPEKKLEMVDRASVVDRSREMRMKKTQDMSIRDFDDEYEILLLDEARVRRKSKVDYGKSRFPENEKMIRIDVPKDVLEAIEAAEKVDTKLEREMKRFRAAKKRYEQDQILSYIRRSYETFDEELDELEMERFEIVHESVYMDLYLLTMHQELIVLKRFENMENELSNTVWNEEKTQAAVKKKYVRYTRLFIKGFSLKIEEKNHHVIKLQDKIKDNMNDYLISVSDDKYFPFLKKICKKKYKVEKEGEGASDSSESSESESSSEGDDGGDDSGSEDSRRLAMLHLDESLCPEGCDRDHYDEAFAVREKRYDMEKRIRDDQRAIEILQKELDAARKRLKTIDNELQADRDKLNTFLREKQRQLNDIDVTVVLRLHQVQCFNLSGEAEKIQNCIVFDKATLSRLYSRVNELQQETADIQVKHKNDKIHFHKLKTDCETMKKELKTMKHTIKKEMEQKFGQQVSLVTLYEAVLRRLIYNIKADTKHLVKFYEEKIENVKIEYKHQLRVLKELIQDNTEKLSFLTVLEEEILKLNKNLKRKLISEEEVEKLESQYVSDLTRLKTILKNQAHQKECISRDINNLRTSKPDLPTLEVPARSTSKILKTQSELMSTSETKASSSVESSYYKKIVAIRHLLTEIVTVNDPNTKETIEEMLRELNENMQRSGYCKEEIEQNIIEIIQNSGDEFSQTSSVDTIENVRKMVYRCNVMGGKKCQRDISYDVEDVLNRLFLSMGVKKDTDEIKDDLIYKLKMTDNIDEALDYLMQNFASDIDDDMKESIGEKIKPTLISLMENIKFAECEERESQEGKHDSSCH